VNQRITKLLRDEAAIVAQTLCVRVEFEDWWQAVRLPENR
jgi:hypothetical protein